MQACFCCCLWVSWGACPAPRVEGGWSLLDFGSCQHKGINWVAVCGGDAAQRCGLGSGADSECVWWSQCGLEKQKVWRPNGGSGAGALVLHSKHTHTHPVQANNQSPQPCRMAELMGTNMNVHVLVPPR